MYSCICVFVYLFFSVLLRASLCPPCPVFLPWNHRDAETRRNMKLEEWCIGFFAAVFFAALRGIFSRGGAEEQRKCSANWLICGFVYSCIPFFSVLLRASLCPSCSVPLIISMAFTDHYHQTSYSPSVIKLLHLSTLRKMQSHEKGSSPIRQH